MFTTKTTPTIVGNGKIKEGVEIKNGNLYIGHALKFEGGKWYRLGDDEKWYYLGLGANPDYRTDANGVLNGVLFEGAFEKVEAD
jgi:hypothetical protein